MSTTTSASVNRAQRRAPALRLSLAVIASIVALALVDVSLEKTEQLELAQSARRADRNGSQLLKRGNTDEAVEAFRKAHSLERENTGYQLDLIQALMADGKSAEAEPLMSDILEEESNAGQANLVAARLAAQQSHTTTADAYYHRAVYGEWPDRVTQHQIAVRMELIQFLNTHGKQNEILAELLPLEEQAGKDPVLQPQIAQLFLTAGSPSRAEAIYRRLIKQNSRNAMAYAGLGDSELALGDFRAARSAFAAAVARDAGNPAWHSQLELATSLNSLDPTLRWLSPQDKYSRARQILQLAASDLQQCITNHLELATDDAKQLLDSADADLRSEPPKQVTNDLAEDTLSLAQKIWHMRTSLCGPSTASDEEALRLSMEKLSK